MLPPLPPAALGFGAMGVLDDAIREHLELRRRHGAPEGELERKQAEALGPARREVTQAPAEAENTAAASAGIEAPAGEPPLDESTGAEPAATDDLLPADTTGGDPHAAGESSATELPASEEEHDPLTERFDPERLRRSVVGDEPRDDDEIFAASLPGEAGYVEEGHDDTELLTEEEAAEQRAQLADDLSEEDELVEADGMIEGDNILDDDEDGELADETYAPATQPGDAGPVLEGLPPLAHDEQETLEHDLVEEEEDAEYGRPSDPPTAFAHDEDEYGPIDENEDVLEETPDFLQETPEHERLWFEQKPPRDFDLDDK